VVEHEGAAIPVQVTWTGPSERHQRAVDEFHEEQPHSGEAVWVTPETYGAGLTDLPDDHSAPSDRWTEIDPGG
jgi:hypothetical protein